MTALALGPGSISAHELDGLLADLDLDALPSAAAEVVLNEEQHAALDAALERIETYENQFVHDGVPIQEDPLTIEELVADLEEPVAIVEEIVPEAEPIAAAAPLAPTPASKAPKKAAAPKTAFTRVTSDLSSLPAEAFRLILGGAVDDEHKAAVIRNRPLQKKVGEKFDNVIGAVAANRTPSVFVMIAFKVLQAKSEITTSDIVAAMRASYNEGTARSQAGQMSVLFPTLGIAKKDGKTLSLNPNSAFAHKLAALAAA